MFCVFCSEACANVSGSCLVTLQMGDRGDSCVVFQAACPPHGDCKSVLETLVMASHVVHIGADGTHQVGCHERVLSGLRSQSVTALSQRWTEWTRLEKRTTRADYQGCDMDGHEDCHGSRRDQCSVQGQGLAGL